MKTLKGVQENLLLTWIFKKNALTGVKKLCQVKYEIEKENQIHNSKVCSITKHSSSLLVINQTLIKSS